MGLFSFLWSIFLSLQFYYSFMSFHLDHYFYIYVLERGINTKKVKCARNNGLGVETPYWLYLN